MSLAHAIDRRLASTHADQPTFTIAEVARLLDVTPAAIQMAELRGRIPRATREVGGDDRVFFLEDLPRLRAHFKR